MKVYFNLFFLFAVITCNAQFDTNKKVLNIAPVTSSSGQVSTTSSSSIKYPSIFDKKDKLLESVSLLKKKEEEQKSVMEKENFQNPSKEYTDRMNNDMKKEGVTSVVENDDFFLGEFTTTTLKLNVGCRDSGEIDGDNVCFWLNGKKVIPAVYLDYSFKQYHFELNEGLNIIYIEALNTGQLFPNTGQFAFFDANGKLITNQQWQLNTGYKAIVKIRKINGIEEVENKD